MKTKICRSCKKRKSISCFSRYIPAKDGLAYYCKECMSKRGKEYYSRKSGKRTIRKYSLKTKFGLSLEDYDKMFEAQNGVCAICGGVNPNRRLAVDHNHITSQVRQLLCTKCNNGLGNFKTDEKGIELLLKAIDYIRKTDMGNVYP